MTKIALFVLTFVYLMSPVMAVYLFYEDFNNGAARGIVVDFRDEDDVPDRGKRLGEVLSKRSVSFTERESIPVDKGGYASYERREKCFFKSPQVGTFIRWVEEAQEIQSIHFLGITWDYQVESMKEALLLLARQYQLNREVDEFIIVSDFISLQQKDEIELDTIVRPTDTRAYDFRQKMKKVSLVCSGEKANAAREALKAILSKNFSDLQENFTIE